MMDLIRLASALIAPLLIGSIVLRMLAGQRNDFFFLERMCVAFGIGWGVITLSMFYMSLAGIPFSPLTCALFPLLLMLTVVIALKILNPSRHHSSRQGFSSREAPFMNRWSLGEISLMIVMILSMGFLVFDTMLMGNDIWDGWSVWGFKAKIYFIHKNIPFELFKNSFGSVWGNWDYPHHVPLMETWVFLWLGYWNDQLSRIIFPLFHAGLAICSYAFFRRYSSRFLSLCGAFFILTLPGLCIMTTGVISEPVVLFYYVMSFQLLLRWEETHRSTFFFLSAILIGLAAWTKNEGMVYAIFNLAVVFLAARAMTLARRSLFIFSYAGVVGLIISPWWILKSSLGLKNILINSDHLSMPLVMNHFLSIGRAVEMLIKIFLKWNYSGFAWIMFFAFLICNWKVSRLRPYCYVLFSMFLHVSLALGFYLLDPSEQYLRDAFMRLSLAPAVLGIIYAVLIQKENQNLGCVGFIK